MSHLERNAFSVPQIDPHYVTELLARLVTIDSVNPTLVDGGAGEAEIAHFVARELRGFGMDVTLLETEHGRVNVVGIRKGRGGGRSLMLYGHLDTVGVVGMYRPLTPVIETTRMYGRGTYDYERRVGSLRRRRQSAPRSRH